jgi:hypothetical protein
MSSDKLPPSISRGTIKTMTVSRLGSELRSVCAIIDLVDRSTDACAAKRCTVRRIYARLKDKTGPQGGTARLQGVPVTIAGAAGRDGIFIIP